MKIMPCVNCYISNFVEEHCDASRDERYDGTGESKTMEGVSIVPSVFAKYLITSTDVHGMCFPTLQRRL